MPQRGGIGMAYEFDAGLYLTRARAVEATFGNQAFHRDRYATLLGFQGAANPSWPRDWTGAPALRSRRAVGKGLHSWSFPNTIRLRTESARELAERTRGGDR